MNLHFKTVTYERYIDASLNCILTQARNEVLGKNFKKKRISKKKEKKIRELIDRKMRVKYGRYVTMRRFKIKDIGTTLFQSNLDIVFTVPGYGKLYGCYYQKSCGKGFLTEHCLKRFEERANPEFYQPIVDSLKKRLNIRPNMVDIISGLIMASMFEYGRSDDFFHLSVGVGVLVIEDLGDVFIAKTFLSPDIVETKEYIKWYKTELPDDFGSFKSIHEVINGCNSTPIDYPNFITCNDDIYVNE